MRRQSTIYQPPPAWLGIALQKILWICALLLTITTGSMYGQVTQGSITKAITSNNPTLSSGTIPSGEVFTYTITFSISGTAPATGVMVTDVVPAALTVVNVIAGSYPVTISPPSPTGTTVSINCGTVNAGAGGQVQINVKFKEGETCDGTRACNFATLTAQNFAVNPVKSDEVCVTATASNKFTIKKKFLMNLPNSVIRWEIAVNNPPGSHIGGYNLHTPLLQDFIPTGAIINNIQVAPTSWAAGPITNINTGLGTWNDNTLPVAWWGYQRVYWVDVQYPTTSFPDTSVVRNCAKLLADFACPNDSIVLNSCDSAKVRGNVTIAPSGTLSKGLYLGALNAGPFSPGCTGRYVVAFSNTGNIGVNNVELDDNLPHEIDVTQIATAAAPQCLKVEYWTTVGTTTTGPTVINAPPTYLNVNHSGTSTATTIGLPASGYITRIRWTYSTISILQTLYNSVSFTILPAKHSNASDLTTPGDIIVNTIMASGTGINTMVVYHQTTVSSYKPLITLGKDVYNCANGAPFLPGDVARFRLVIGNYGNAPAGPFAITDVLPTYFSYVGNERYYYISGGWGAFYSIGA